MQTWIENRQDTAPVHNDAEVVKAMIVGAGPEGARKKLLYKRVDLPVTLVDALLQAWLDLRKIEICKTGDDEIVKWVGGLR